MLNDLENTIIATLKELGTVLPSDDTTMGEIDDGMKLDIAICGAKLMRQLQKQCEGDEPISEEFFLEFAKNTPVVMREMFVFGGLTFLSQVVQN